jgi:hypothetical protein
MESSNALVCSRPTMMGQLLQWILTPESDGASKEHPLAIMILLVATLGASIPVLVPFVPGPMLVSIHE